MACHLAIGWRGRQLLALGIAALLLFIGSAWLPETRLQDCSAFWPCMSLYNTAVDGSLNPEAGSPVSSVGSSQPIPQCPDQRFQMSRVVREFTDAVTEDQDVLLEHYLSGWEELVKFMEALGSVLGFISQDVTGKIGVVRELALGGSDRASGDAYRTLRSMIRMELARGIVNFRVKTASGCRTVLVLNRALKWLELFLEKLGRDKRRSPSELCREAYLQALARHHSWLMQRAAELAFLAVPERPEFLHIVCARDERGVARVLGSALPAIGRVYNLTRDTLAEHNMLNLP
ncbi:ceramide-1-phosphate transfer protein isoform X1 [Lepisosteus oculatus]|uniref:ceramide-1-phosphate transfer protein isoform X1 n=1 Tax=Lepisosteus oculatus TaxID=7918 RepID=UPI00371038C4